MTARVRRVLVPLAEGFEEIELTTLVDVLRRAEVDVTIASLGRGPVRGSHGIAIVPDAAFADLDPDSFDALVLAGGQPGSRNLAADERILALVRRLVRERQPVAAICAAPIVLHAAGVLAGVEVTSHPSVRALLTGAIVRDEPRVVRDGAITTSQGAGTALELALALVRDFVGAERAEALARAMVVARAGG